MQLVRITSVEAQVRLFETSRRLIVCGAKDALLASSKFTRMSIHRLYAMYITGMHKTMLDSSTYRHIIHSEDSYKGVGTLIAPNSTENVQVCSCKACRVVHSTLHSNTNLTISRHQKIED